MDDVQGLVAMGEQLGESAESSGGLAEPPSDEDAKEAPADGLKEPPGAAPVAATAGEAERRRYGRARCGRALADA